MSKKDKEQQGKERKISEILRAFYDVLSCKSAFNTFSCFSSRRGGERGRREG